MAFYYTRAPWTQHLLSGTLLLLAIALGATDAFAGAWFNVVQRLDGRVLLTGGLIGLHTLIYYPVCLAFHYVDTHDKPDFIARYRIQRSKRKHPDLPKTLRVLFRNQFLILPVLLLLLGEVLFWRGWTVEAELPSLGRFLFELVGQSSPPRPRRQYGGWCGCIAFITSFVPRPHGPANIPIRSSLSSETSSP